ncbi:MAG: sodium-translocating pyrophosphatase [Planctomycetota bacterium]|nr:MAG: sodium-translocating pyrophosphatase [Planctomycetota bacterium]
MEPLLHHLPWISGVLGLIVAFVFMRRVLGAPAGDDGMNAIARAVQEGAMAFLTTQYKILVVFALLVAGAFLLLPETLGGGPRTAIAYLTGAFTSALTGFIGMYTATRAAVRTTQAAKTSLAGALTIAFGSGSVMGFAVVGLGVLGVWGFTRLFSGEDGLLNNLEISQIVGFSFGASSIALFARVGGGIYTKAADVGADLVGKVETGIPEDDPRNPAVIADNVGDNVGDVAGMGADLFESYVGSIISTMVIGVAMYALNSEAAPLISLPLTLAGAGIISSIVGALFVRTNNEKQIQGALFRGLIVASIVLMVLAFFLTRGIPDITVETRTFTGLGLFWAIVAGLFAGVAIGKISEYYTSGDYKPVQSIAEQCETGAATNVIAGLGVGMKSTGFPILVVCAAIWVAFFFAGIYGISLAAVGMLATLGISLAVDAYGPVADNAGGVAEMSHQPKEVRQRTDSLDAVGNTTAAIGKGFAICSAALTALAFFAAYGAAAGAEAGKRGLEFNLSVTNSNVVIGMFLGGMLPFLFSAMAMQAVGRAAFSMIGEVRRQFRENPGILAGTVRPDYARCVSISTKGALREMILPGLLAILTPLVVGKVGNWMDPENPLSGVEMVGGLLAGATITGVMLAIFMANAGGAWDNAKKYIEGGHYGGKGSAPHKAAVVGDTVGDPFKDTAGPSLNILIKMMSVLSLILLPFFAR